ncbi:hypothetical protein ACLOJK_014591, partial [Asimina triloba]
VPSRCSRPITVAPSATVPVAGHYMVFFLSLQPYLLPLRDGGTFHVEPYFLISFGREFGYDQGVPEHLAVISLEACEVGVRSSSRRSTLVARRKLPKQRLYAFKPWDLSLPYYYRSDRGRELGVGKHHLLFYDALMEEEEFQMREPEARSPEEMIFSEDGSHFRPFIRIARESALPLALCRCSVNAPRHHLSQVVRPATVPDPSKDERAPESSIDLSDSSEEALLEGAREVASDTSPGRSFDEAHEEATPTVDVVEEAIVAPMSSIRSVGGGGSVGSVGETPRVSEDVVAGHRSPIGSTGSGGEVFITAGRVGLALIIESISVVPPTHSPGSFSHISLPLSTISDLFFSEGGANDLSIDNVNRSLGLPSADAPILSGSFFALASSRRAERSPSSVDRVESSGEGGSTSKSVDVASGSAAEPVSPVEGRVAEAVVLDSDEGSSGNSLVGQHVPTGGDHRVAVSEGSRGSSSSPAFLLDVNVEFIEPFRELASSCFARLQRPLRSMIQRHLAHSLSFFREVFIKDLDDMEDPDDFDYLLKLYSNLEQSSRYLGAELNQLVEEHGAEVAIITSANACMEGINAKLLACKKAMEEQKASIISDSSLLQETERHLVLTLLDLKKIEEVKVAPPSLASVWSALEALRVMSRDGLLFP